MSLANTNNFDDLFRQIENVRNTKGPSSAETHCKVIDKGFYEYEDGKIVRAINDSLFLEYKRYVDSKLLYANDTPNLSLDYHKQLAGNILGLYLFGGINNPYYFDDDYLPESKNDTTFFIKYAQLFCNDSLVKAPYEFYNYRGYNDLDGNIDSAIKDLLKNKKKPTVIDLNLIAKQIQQSNTDEIWKIRRLLHLEYFNFINSKDTSTFNVVLNDIERYLLKNKVILNDTFIVTLYSDLSKSYFILGNNDKCLEMNLKSKTRIREKVKNGGIPYSFEFEYYNDNYSFYRFNYSFNNVIAENLLNKYDELNYNLPIDSFPPHYYFYDTA